VSLPTAQFPCHPFFHTLLQGGLNHEFPARFFSTLNHALLPFYPFDASVDSPEIFQWFSSKLSALAWR